MSGHARKTITPGGENKVLPPQHEMTECVVCVCECERETALGKGQAKKKRGYAKTPYSMGDSVDQDSRTEKGKKSRPGTIGETGRSLLWAAV